MSRCSFSLLHSAPSTASIPIIRRSFSSSSSLVLLHNPRPLPPPLPQAPNSFLHPDKDKNNLGLSPKKCAFSAWLTLLFAQFCLDFDFSFSFPRSSERAYFLSFNCLKTNVVLPIISSAPPLLETLHPRLLRYRAFSCDMDRPPHFHNAHCN